MTQGSALALRALCFSSFLSSFAFTPAVAKISLAFISPELATSDFGSYRLCNGEGGGGKECYLGGGCVRLRAAEAAFTSEAGVSRHALSLLDPAPIATAAVAAAAAAAAARAAAHAAARTVAHAATATRPSLQC